MNLIKRILQKEGILLIEILSSGRFLHTFKSGAETSLHLFFNVGTSRKSQKATMRTIHEIRCHDMT